MGRKWLPEEDELFKKLYPTTPNHDLMEMFKRSEGAIQARAGGLGVQKEAKKIKRNDKRRTHIQTGVLRRIIDRQHRAGFLEKSR